MAYAGPMTKPVPAILAPERARLKAPLRNSDLTLLVSPGGGVFAIGFPLYAQPKSTLFPGTKWWQVPQFNAMKNVNPNTAPADVTPVTRFTVINNISPAFGFSTPVQIGVAGG